MKEQKVLQEKLKRVEVGWELVVMLVMLKTKVREARTLIIVMMMTLVVVMVGKRS